MGIDRGQPKQPGVLHYIQIISSCWSECSYCYHQVIMRHKTASQLVRRKALGMALWVLYKLLPTSIQISTSVNSCEWWFHQRLPQDFPNLGPLFAHLPMSCKMTRELCKGYLLLSGNQNKKSSPEPAIIFSKFARINFCKTKSLSKSSFVLKKCKADSCWKPAPRNATGWIFPEFS